MKNESKDNERTSKFLAQLEKIGNVLSSLGIKEKSVLSVANDLCEVYQYSEDVKKNIDSLLEVEKSDKGKLQDIFVELEVLLFHINEHIVNSREHLLYLAELCDDDKVE